jgi:hypothetical protein
MDGHWFIEFSVLEEYATAFSEFSRGFLEDTRV